MLSDPLLRLVKTGLTNTIAPSSIQIHKTKEEAIEAIKKYAKVMREISAETGADFFADALDDTGIEYYIQAVYKSPNGRMQEVSIHFQELDL